MKNKPILFVDFDGTICFDKYWRSLPADKFEVVQSLIFGKANGLVNDWMRGKYTAEEVNHLLADKAGLQYEPLWKLFVNDCETMKISLAVLQKIDSMRQKYTAVLVTGNMDSFTRFTVPALGLDKYFDHINNSFLVGKLKDDSKGATFMEYAKSLDVSIKDCFLIDNSPNACSVFQELGGTALLIKDEWDINYYLDKLK